MEEVMRSLLDGDAWWKPETGECVFYDDVFDEPPEGPGGTFCRTWVDLEKASRGDIWAGYSPDKDDYVGRLEAVTEICSQPGWERVPR